jgi:hypothetical protein
MAEGQVRWIISRGISLRDAAEWVGFKIEKLRDFSQVTQNELKAKVVNSIISDLDTEWDYQAEKGGFTNFSNKLTQVEKGIYVLCLDGGLCVNYAQRYSKVVYIGKGKIRHRIKSHLELKLLDFFLQIPGLQFSFYMTEPKKPGRNGGEYFHDFEHDLLEEFSKLYGGQRPIFNRNAGRRHDNQHEHKGGWKLPLKNTKAGYVWSLSSTTVEAPPKLED